MKVLSSIALILSFSATAFAAPLTCSEIEKFEDADGSLNYFKEVKYETAEIKAQDGARMRRAVKDYYGECGVDAEYEELDYCYRWTMTLKEVDELGENVGIETVAGKDGTLYRQVNVGFGGGNSANYYFEIPTVSVEDPLPFMIKDGAECSPWESVNTKKERDAIRAKNKIRVAKLQKKAVAIALPIAKKNNLKISKKCMTNLETAWGSSFKKFPKGYEGYSVPTGDRVDCDPHSAIDVIFDAQGKFLGTNLIDS